jgi:hypothetical protein
MGSASPRFSRRDVDGYIIEVCYSCSENLWSHQAMDASRAPTYRIAYFSPGTYTYECCVTDSDGLGACAQTSVTVHSSKHTTLSASPS